MKSQKVLINLSDTNQISNLISTMDIGIPRRNLSSILINSFIYLINQEEGIAT